MLKAALRSGSRRGSKVQPPEKVYNKAFDLECFGYVLQLALRRLSVKVCQHLYPCLGESWEHFVKLNRTLGTKGVERVTYSQFFRGLPLLKGMQLDVSSPLLKPDTKLMERVTDPPSKDSKAYVLDILRNVMCQAEKDLFAGQPNVHELQKNARKVARNKKLDEYDVVAFYEFRQPSVSFGSPDLEYSVADIIPFDNYVGDPLFQSYEDALVRAEVVADAGGLPEFGGLVPLFKFELPHARELGHYQRKLKLAREGSKSESKPALETHWTKGSEDDTIVITAPGLQSKNDVKLVRIPLGLKVLVGSKSRTLPFPAQRPVEQAKLVVDESNGLIRITVPEPSDAERHEHRLMWGRDG